MCGGWTVFSSFESGKRYVRLPLSGVVIPFLGMGRMASWWKGPLKDQRFGLVRPHIIFCLVGVPEQSSQVWGREETPLVLPGLSVWSLAIYCIVYIPLQTASSSLYCPWTFMDSEGFSSLSCHSLGEWMFVYSINCSHSSRSRFTEFITNSRRAHVW